MKLLTTLPILTAVIGLTILHACSASKTYVGTVQSTENGKDGYTAYLVNDKGEKFDAVLSIPKMEKNYQVLKAGDQVKIQGDTIHFDNRIRVIAIKVKKVSF